MIFICCENRCGITANQVNKTVGTHVLVPVETAISCNFVSFIVIADHMKLHGKRNSKIFFFQQKTFHIYGIADFI